MSVCGCGPMYGPYLASSIMSICSELGSLVPLQKIGKCSHGCFASVHLCCLCLRLEPALGEYWTQLGEVFQQALFISVCLICLGCAYALCLPFGCCCLLTSVFHGHFSLVLQAPCLAVIPGAGKEQLLSHQAVCEERLPSPYFCGCQCERLDRGWVTACRVLCTFLLPFLLLTTCVEMETNTSRAGSSTAFYTSLLPVVPLCPRRSSVLPTAAVAWAQEGSSGDQGSQKALRRFVVVIKRKGVIRHYF